MQRPPAPEGPTQTQIRLHGSCAAHSCKGVLLLGRPGSGKSDLLLRLVDRGFDLVADDQVLIQAGHASPPASLAGLIELRGLGLLRMTYLAPIPLVLVLALDDAADQDADAPLGDGRLPLPRRHRRLDLPLLRIDPFAASTPIRIEIALDCLRGQRVLLAGGLP